ncbi:Oidioi.mRNA.OKI2018_I69.PAR.g10963.t1.cds [Oikopleura dioica]|uniref:Ferritin n=1 Tax=Oikopleura dioica TaxID=34765 RepID=A0ABN7S059_OIKDI|nr:Oidioi.mRNA.OKI2018_I69.PAR.g10963.t1.cds [Oikopleura dioica]
MRILFFASVVFANPENRTNHLDYEAEWGSQTRARESQRTRDECNFDQLLNAQINKEFTASYFYYSLAQKFKFHTNRRPNLAHFFEDRATEERGHGEKLVNFQLERGVVAEFYDIKFQTAKIHDDISMLESLKISLAMEIILTDELKTLLKIAEDGCGTCKNTDDVLINSHCQAPHIAEIISSEYLPDQMKDINHLKGLIKTLSDMVEDAPRYLQLQHEMFFDKHILSQ